MTQEEAKDLIAELLFLAQKVKSNATEALAGHAEPTETEKRVLEFLNPCLMGAPGHINLVEALYRYSQKDQLEPVDVFNALVLANKDSLVRAGYLLRHGEELPNATKTMIAMMKGQS